MAASALGGNDGVTAGRTPGCRTPRRKPGQRVPPAGEGRPGRAGTAPRPERSRVAADAKWRLDPSDGRTWRGYVRDMTQKLLAKPTRPRVKRDFWRPDEPRLFVRKARGRGWTVNFARIFRRGDTR